MLFLLLACAKTDSVDSPQDRDSPGDSVHDSVPVDDSGETGDTGEFRWPSSGLVLDQVQVFDAMGLQTQRAVVISGGEIWAVVAAAQDWPAGLEVQDWTGHTVIPGLIDSHVHLSYSGAPWWVGDTVEQNLASTLRWGVVAVVDLGGPQWSLSLRDRVASGELVGPRILATGPFLTSLGSHPCELYLDEKLCIFVDGDGAERGSAQRSLGSDFLKVALTDVGIDRIWPKLDVVDLAEILSGGQAVVHVGSPQELADAQAAGAQHIAHTPFSEALSSQQAALPFVSMSTTVGANEGLVRVLGRELSEAERASVPEGVLESWDLVAAQPTLVSAGWPQAAQRWATQTRENLQQLRAQSAPLLAGTDAGYYFVPHGSALHRELEAMVEAGYSEQEALAAATLLPAQNWGWTDLGLVAQGYAADLLILSADPSQDIANTRQIARVLVGGLVPGATWQSQGGSFCLDDRDCADGACDAVDHVCLDACATYGLLECDAYSWCRPQDGFASDSDGVCSPEHACDLYAQDCHEHYAQACIPRDLDSNECVAAGPRTQGQSCSSANPKLRCEVGSYCSALTSTCYELCDPSAAESCATGTCHQEYGAGQEWFGLCY